MNSSEDTTLILQTTKNTDADIFIQKGTSLPTPTSYYLKSTNFASDEITIPRNENSGMTNKTVYYTVGVYGVTSNCAYTLVAISNTFRVINYDLGQIVSSSMSNTNPLVLRVPPHLEGVPLRIFFYSGTSGVKLMLVNESDDGILHSIPPHSRNSSIVQFLKAQGIAGVYKFPVKKNYDFSTRSQSLLVFYPDQYFGSVSAVIAHPNLPVKYKEGQDPFYFKLDKDENITISVSALNPGELSQMKFILHGSRKEDYVLTFDKT